MSNDLIDLMELPRPEKPVEIFQGDALEYLQGVYQGRIKAEHTRMRAAATALPFERPKLAVAAIFHPDGSFAERLERAITRSQSPTKLIAPTKVVEIEHDRSELGPKPRPKPNNFIRRS
jgi:hypothetical protein